MLSFTKSYELPLRRDYVRHWGLVEAVREILQNAIDSDSPLEWSFDYQIEEDHWTDEGVVTRKPTGIASLSIRSPFSTLAIDTLLLGSTSKEGNPNAIGSFGEGYKIALLVLARLGMDVKLHNGDKTWRPEFRASRQFNGAETLHIIETSGGSRSRGIEFVIHGLSAGDEAAIRDSCLQMQSDLGETIETSYGRILLARPGKLYVGGLMVCETEMLHGYDVKPQHLRLERDRQTVSGFDLALITKNMWFEAKRMDQVIEMLKAEAPDMQYANYSTPEVVKDACYRAFREKHPHAIVVKSLEELEKKVAQGMTRERVVHAGPVFGAIVSSSKHYKSEPFTAVEPPVAIMEKFLREHRSEMRTPAIVEFKKLIKVSSAWKV